MYTGYIVYNDNFNNLSSNNPYSSGDYDNPKFRSPSEQMDCIYINKKICSEKAVCILIGYGLILEAKNLFDKISKKIPNNRFFKYNSFFKNQLNL